MYRDPGRLLMCNVSLDDEKFEQDIFNDVVTPLIEDNEVFDRADRPVHRSIEDSYWIEGYQLSRGKPDILGRTLANFGIAFAAGEYVSAIPKVDYKGDSALHTNWIDGRNGVAIVNLMDKTRHDEEDNGEL